MNGGASKITADHLRRDAYLYVRQSTLHQVLENTESTKRQYALRQRAVALGWPLERVIVVDQDLGQSAAGASERSGFHQLFAAVGMGKAGIVLGLEVSRLARSSVEWHRLLEICALTDTLILDEDGLYDPGHFNDRLLLGLKGTMSEAELHVIRARLLGGLRSKAQRGELKVRLPAGFAYDAVGRLVRDPDHRVRGAVELFFETFRRTGSAWATVKHFRDEKLLFPIRLWTGSRKGEVVFQALHHERAIDILHNPRYAGAFAFGRSRVRRRPNRAVQVEKLPREQWQVLIPDVHEGYITWAQYEANAQRLRENALARGHDRRSPAREGPALLQGLAVCGRCGEPMLVSYHVRQDGTKLPSYFCGIGRIQRGEPTCQSMGGRQLDEAVGELLVGAMTPLNLDVALAVGDELRARAEQVDRLRRQHLEGVRYEAELAERRYRRVDPDHRLVADALEADWNDRLRRLAQAQEEYERQREADRHVLDEKARQEILRLATDFPRLWHDPRTPLREKKRIARLLIEDVTLLKGEQLTAHVRFKGGAVRTLTLPLPRSAPDLRRTEPAVLKRVDQLLDHHTEEEVAEQLNAEGLRTGTGLPFTSARVRGLRLRHGLRSRLYRLGDRLLASGQMTSDQMATQIGVSPNTVRQWAKAGHLTSRRYGPVLLYDPPGPDHPKPQQGKKRLPPTLMP